MILAVLTLIDPKQPKSSLTCGKYDVRRMSGILVVVVVAGRTQSRTISEQNTPPITLFSFFSFSLFLYFKLLSERQVGVVSNFFFLLVCLLTISEVEFGRRSRAQAGDQTFLYTGIQFNSLNSKMRRFDCNGVINRVVGWSGYVIELFIRLGEGQFDVQQVWQ